MEPPQYSGMDAGLAIAISKLRYAHGLVGPPLTNMKSRMYVAGVLQNNPENMVLWIRNPQAVDEKTAMPNLSVSPQDATDIAAISLYLLKEVL